MQKTKLQHLAEVVERTLRDGKNVIVIGWLRENHNDLTRKFARTDRILFVEKGEKVAVSAEDVVITTNYASYTRTKKAPKTVTSPCLQPAEIKRILLLLDENRVLETEGDLPEDTFVEEPTYPIEKLRLLLSQKSAIVSELALLREKLSYLENQLTRIESEEMLLLEDFLKSSQ